MIALVVCCRVVAVVFLLAASASKLSTIASAVVGFTAAISPFAMIRGP